MIRKVMEMSMREEEERLRRANEQSDPQAVSPQDYKQREEEKEPEIIQPVVVTPAPAESTQKYEQPKPVEQPKP